MNSIFIQQLGFDGFLVETANVSARYPDYADIVKTGADRVYFSAGKPAVLFVDVDAFDNEGLRRISQVQHNAWNYQRILLLYATTNTEIRIYNCFEIPVNPNSDNEDDRQLKPIQLEGRSIGDDISVLLQLFNRVNVDNGTLWTTEAEIRSRIRKDRRVDAFLIESMCEAAKLLVNDGLPIDVIHALLIRSLFILFLEDKGAASEAGLYETIKPGAKKYFDLLEDKEATYGLFGRLQEQFNGNITSLVEDEENLVTQEHLEVIRDCFFDGEFSHQPRLFDRDQLFNFEIIHIGLISEIYENFLGELKHDRGQFYTPFSLADMILSEVLPTSKGESQHPLLDMSCGSGIFLVEGYKRLIARWKREHPGQTISFSTLVSLLTNNVFGIEIDTTAIRVAAFSLYLTLIDQLDPKTLWNTGNCRLPYLIYDPDDPSLEGRQGRNLWRRNTISEVDVESFPNIKLLVGNPPYGTKNLNPEIKQYCQRNHFAAEYVLPFMHKATKFCPKGDIALVFTSKVLFNTGGGYAQFRRWLFNENTVRRIDNLSIFRKAHSSFGGSLFSSATCPVCVAYYTAKPALKDASLFFYSPKSFIKSNLIDGLVVDESDVKTLPMAECQNPHSIIWKVAAWGNYYGFELIKRASSKTLEQYFKDNNWIFGRGLNADSKRQDFVPSPIVGTAHIDRYRTDLSVAKINTTKRFRSVQERLFEPPLVVFKQGQHNGEIACSLFMEKAYFTTTANALNCDNEDDKKILTAYLNSRLAKYFLFLTSSSWGVEREQIYLKEILNLPSPFEGLTNDSRRIVVECFNEIYEILCGALPDRNRIKQLETTIEGQLEAAFAFSEKDRIYINDTLDYNVGIFQKGGNAKGYFQVWATEAKSYADTLLYSLSKMIEGTGLMPSITYYETTVNDPLLLVAIELKGESSKVICGTIDGFKDILQKIDTYLWGRQSESVYMKKMLKYYEQSRVYIIKPNQKRFWSRMQAFDDAASIVNDIMSM